MKKTNQQRVMQDEKKKKKRIYKKLRKKKKEKKVIQKAKKNKRDRNEAIKMSKKIAAAYKKKDGEYLQKAEDLGISKEEYILRFVPPRRSKYGGSEIAGKGLN